MGLKIWLDDVRSPPDASWTWCETATSCLHIINDVGLEQIDAISFDNDLGDGNLEGYQVLNRVEEYCHILILKSVPILTVHSANPVARQRMETIIERIQNLYP